MLVSAVVENTGRGHQLWNHHTQAWVPQQTPQWWNRHTQAWVTPSFNYFRSLRDPAFIQNGYVKTLDPTDDRLYLSQWGDAGSKELGCCADTYQDKIGHGWKKAFSMTYAVCAPTDCEDSNFVVANCKGSEYCKMQINWAEKCKAVPSGTAYITVTMGKNVDRFRPIAGSTYCDMLASSNKHQFWNPDPLDGSEAGWVTPEYYHGGRYHMGGSAYGWPSKNIVGDSRTILPFWGQRGGSMQYGACCHDTKSDSHTWWRSFTMKAYGEDCAPTASSSGARRLSEGTTTVHETHTRHAGY